MSAPTDPYISSASESLDKAALYAAVTARIRALIDGIADDIAPMATIACELHHTFKHFHWTGFYRVKGTDTLVIGPYQGGHGCLVIPFAKGVCGACATARATIIVPDVHAFAGHIACSATTRSEIVVPVLTPDGGLVAVLDVDSDLPDAFDSIDRDGLETICHILGAHIASVA